MIWDEQGRGSAFAEPSALTVYQRLWLVFHYLVRIHSTRGTWVASLLLC